jgi:hypothetical protein
MKWIFEDPTNVAVLTTNNVMNRLKPILYVSHDEEDGMWQFHDGEKVQIEEAKILSLLEITEIDPGIIALHDLPEGWIAYRSSIDSNWIRTKKK